MVGAAGVSRGSKQLLSCSRVLSSPKGQRVWSNSRDGAQAGPDQQGVGGGVRCNVEILGVISWALRTLTPALCSSPEGCQASLDSRHGQLILSFTNSCTDNRNYAWALDLSPADLHLMQIHALCQSKSPISRRSGEGRQYHWTGSCLPCLSVRRPEEKQEGWFV